MSAATPTEALASVYALIATTTSSHVSPPVAALSALGVSKVYDHEPGPRGADTPVAVTLCSAGWTPTDWLIDARVYVSGQTYDPATQQETLRAVAYLLDQTIPSEGPSQSDASWEEELDAWVQTNRYMIGREDF